jgi:hypothetical protein
MEAEVGERSRSDSDFSEFEERVVDDQGGRTAAVMKLGRGGAREAESSSAKYSFKWETSSLEVGTCVRSSAFVCWRSLDILRREKGQVRGQKNQRGAEKDWERGR